MGDRIRLSNQRGEAFFVARLSTRVTPGVVRTAKCNWRSTNPYGKGTNTNTLTTSKLTDMGGCSAYHSTRVDNRYCLPEYRRPFYRCCSSYITV